MTVEDNGKTKIFNGSGNEIKNSKFFNGNEYKMRQLIKHQLFTADVDITSLRSCINNVSFTLQ